MLIMFRPWVLWSLLGLLVLWLVVRQAGGVLTPFVLGLAVAYFLDPLADRLERLGLSRAWAITVIALGFVAAMVAGALWLLPTLLGQARQAIEAMPGALRSGFRFLTERFPEAMEQGTVVQRFVTDVVERLRLTVLQMLGGTLSTVVNAVTTGLIAVATFTISVYLLYDWDRLVTGVNRRLPPAHAPLIRRLARDIDDVLTRFVRGQLIVGAILATFYSVALMGVGLNYALLIAIAAGVLNFIPYLGSTSGFVIATGVAVVQFWGDWWKIALVAAIFIFGQVAEGNVITPRIVGDSVKLHPVTLMLALALGGVLFGFPGLLLAVPTAAALGVVGRHYDAEWLAHIARPPRR